MPFEIVMPRLGQITDEMEIIRWLKAEGEPVQRGELLLEVLTDKATVEVESWADGVLRRISFKAGEKVASGTVIAIITAPDEEWTPLEEETRFFSKNLVSRGAKKPPTRERKRVKASPLAKKLAAEKGIDLTTVTGSGPGGAITKEDVLKAAAVTGEVPSGRLLPLTSMRRAIGRRMVESKTTIPHFYVSLEVDMSEAVKLRQALNEALEKRGQHTRIRVTDDTDSQLTEMGTSVKSETEIRVSLSPTDILIAAVAAALTEFPQVNARLEERGIRLLEEVNVGLAVSLEEGLIAPIIKAAHTKSLLQIARERAEMVARARAGRLRADELVEGSFTISNMGGYGVDSFAAIINPPQSAILAVGRIADRPVVVEGQIVIRPMMTMTLSIDHRLLDGALAATFLHRLKEIIERPQALLIDVNQLRNQKS